MLDFNKLTDPIATEQLINTVYEKVFEQSFNNNDVTIIGFPGCGKVAYIKYLIRMLPKQTNINNSKRVFGVIDFAILSLDEDAACREFLQNVVNFYTESLNPETMEYINNLLLDTNKVTLTIIKQVIHKLTYDIGISITLVMENFQLYFKNSKIIKLHSHINSIKKSNPMKISLVFLVSGEVAHNELESLGLLKSYFAFIAIWSNNFLFDRESIHYLVKNQETWNQYKLSIEFINCLYSIAGPDPAVVKNIVTKAIRDKAFEANIVNNRDNADKLYNIIGKQTLDERYKRIVTNLHENSLKYLIHELEAPTEYLEKTGMLEIQDGNVQILSKLFMNYIVQNKELIQNLIVINKDITNSKEIIIPQEIINNLTGKELTVFNILLENRNTSREEIAKALWDKEWESKYSDWAIDQVISRIRTKIKDSNFKLKTIKGEGFLLLHQQ